MWTEEKTGSLGLKQGSIDRHWLSTDIWEPPGQTLDIKHAAVRYLRTYSRHMAKGGAKNGKVDDEMRHDMSLIEDNSLLTLIQMKDDLALRGHNWVHFAAAHRTFCTITSNSNFAIINNDNNNKKKFIELESSVWWV